MKKRICLMGLLSALTMQGQDYPSFGDEIDVTIEGLTFDAMEPFIYGDYLFFNNVNDGINTKLYYALRENDSTFTLIGELNGPNQTEPPHLDAVPDVDDFGNFYWTSTRDYPAQLNNLFRGEFNSGNVTDIGRVNGNFNKDIPGWLVMDHGISADGQLLYYNNARFDNENCIGPCETEIGIAQKMNDSTFTVISNSEEILQNINDSNYVYYAPCITSDNLELYYTRFLRDQVTPATVFEICVAVRTSPADVFSEPWVLFSETLFDLIEAPTLTPDKQLIYYHRRTADSHKIVMRRRSASLSANNPLAEGEFTVYPNPTRGPLHLSFSSRLQNMKVSLFNLTGEEVSTFQNQSFIDMSGLSSGVYFLRLELDSRTEILKILKTD